MDVPSAAQIGTIGSLAASYQALVNATASLQAAGVMLEGTLTFTTTASAAVQSFHFTPFTAAETNAVLSSVATVLQNRLTLAQNALTGLPSVTVTTTFGQGPQPVTGATGATGTTGATGATGA